MNNLIYLTLVAKILDCCDCDTGAAVYTLLPTIMHSSEKKNNIEGLALVNHPQILDSALNILTDKSINVAKGSVIYQKIKEKKEELLDSLAEARLVLDLPDQISDEKISAALSLISYCYLNSLLYPTQSFLPNSSSCCGQWEFWDKVNYLNLLQKVQDKYFLLSFQTEILKNGVWETKFKPEDFSEIVRKRLHKEDAFNKKLSSESLIKAMIIRMGEIAQPKINYEIIDYTIRSFFTYLGVKQYLRVDREIKFLRKLEKKIITILAQN